MKCPAGEEIMDRAMTDMGVCVCVFLFFFFQAEDGIRDLVGSRGLGDMYKGRGELRPRPRGGGR